MKSFNAILTIGSILAFAGSALSAPIPEASEAPRIKTVVEYVTEVQVIGVTMTVWVPPGGDSTTEADPTTSSVSADPTTTTEEQITSTTYIRSKKTTSTTIASSSTSISSSTSSVPTTTSSPPPPPTTTKAPETTIEVQTTHKQEPTTTPTPTPTPPLPQADNPKGNGAWTGKATFYNTGMGSCGLQNSDTDMIVALSHFIMAPLNGRNPNTNPLCGTYIECSYGNNKARFKVVDTCEGCERTHVDLSPAGFTALGADFALGVIPVTCAYV